MTDEAVDRHEMNSQLDMFASPGEEQPLMRMSEDDNASNLEVPNVDSSVDTVILRPQPDCANDTSDSIMLLDAQVENLSVQAPCLIPESVVASSTGTGQDVQSVGDDDHSTSPVMMDSDMPNGSVESQPFAFVTDVMRSCSSYPSSSHKLAIYSRTAGGELTAAAFERLKAQGGRQTRKADHTAENVDS